MARQISCTTTIEQVEHEVTNLIRQSGEQTDSAAKRQIALSYGFSTWRHLEVYLLALSNDQTSDFLKHACLSYLNDWWDDERARAMLADDSTLARHDIFHAAATGDVNAVEAFLAVDKNLANQRGGYFGWEPLMYACYSRLNLPGKSCVAAAQCLVDHGADANAFFMWGGQYRFTALTGVFGEGENGPTKCPEHSQCEAMARLLLGAGANPNDGQALYNRMFTPGHKCIQLLLEFGLNADHKCNWWLEDHGMLVQHPEQTLRYQLNWAVKNSHHERARLLIDHGAKLTTKQGEKSLYESAMLAGDEVLAEYLVASGAERSELDQVASFAAACMSGNESAAQMMLDSDPGLMARLQSARPEFVSQAAGGNHLEAIRVIAKLGGDINGPAAVGPLHEAAWSGNLDMIKTLVELGAVVTARDKHHTATPLQWALHNGGHQAVVDFLAQCDIDIFDAVACNNVGRIKKILQDAPGHLEISFGEILGGTKNDENHWQTPLASAVLRNQVDCVRYLLQVGASLSITDTAGRPLLELAQEKSTPEIVALLQSASN